MELCRVVEQRLFFVTAAPSFVLAVASSGLSVVPARVFCYLSKSTLLECPHKLIETVNPFHTSILRLLYKCCLDGRIPSERGSVYAASGDNPVGGLMRL